MAVHLIFSTADNYIYIYVCVCVYSLIIQKKTLHIVIYKSTFMSTLFVGYLQGTPSFYEFQ